MVRDTLGWLVDRGYVEYCKPSKRARVDKSISSGDEVDDII